jgi:hypothetical protein
MRILLLLSLILSSFAHSDVIIGGLSKHYDPMPLAVNEFNPSIGIRTKSGIEVVLYENTFEDPSIYVGHSKHLVNFTYISYSSRLGLAYGYKEAYDYDKTETFHLHTVKAGFTPVVFLLVTPKLTTPFEVDLGISIDVSTLSIRIPYEQNR